MVVVDERQQMPPTTVVPLTWVTRFYYFDPVCTGEFQAQLFLINSGGRNVVYFCDTGGIGTDLHGSWSWWRGDYGITYLHVEFHYLGSRGIRNEGSRCLTFKLFLCPVMFRDREGNLLSRNGGRCTCQASNFNNLFANRVSMAWFLSGPPPAPPPALEDNDSEWQMVPPPPTEF